jgi:DNA polymerase-3 subunit delta
MVAVKAADVDAFVARPDPARRVVLVFGPDAGLVSERVTAILKVSVDDVNDPFALARLDGEELAAEPSRLIEEALTMPLFGGRRAVWVKAGSRNIAPAVEALLGADIFNTGATQCRVVIEAGDLRRNAPLRTLCERGKNAAALPCYPDGERERARLIDDEMKAAGLSLTPDARAVLIPRWFRTHRRWRSRTSSTRPLPADQPSSRPSSPKRAPRAPRRGRFCSTRSVS